MLDKNTARFGELVRAGRGGDVNNLIGAVFKFFEGERAIIERRRHAKTVVNESFIARAVAVIHAAHLRNSLMRFVDEEQIVLRNVIEQCGRRFARQTTTEVAGIIFDAVAIADRSHHFNVE